MMMKAATKKMLSVVGFIADRPRWIVAIATICVLSLHRMLQFTQDLAPSSIPDLQFGFSPASLRALHEEWSDANGCQKYIQAASSNLFPYMECYTLLLAAMLMLATRRQGWDERLSLLPLLTMLLDCGETVILQESCRRTEELPDTVIRVGALCNQAKWISVGLVTAMIAYGVIGPSAKDRKK